MNVACPKCSTSHHIASIPDGGMSYVCPSCAHCFHIEAPQTTPRLSLRSIGGARVLDNNAPAAASTDYFVKRSSGREIGPFKAKMIEQMIRSGQIESATEISVDKVQWNRLSTVPEFAHVFKEDQRGASIPARTSSPPYDPPTLRPPLPNPRLPAPNPPWPISAPPAAPTSNSKMCLLANFLLPNQTLLMTTGIWTMI